MEETKTSFWHDLFSLPFGRAVMFIIIGIGFFILPEIINIYADMPRPKSFVLSVVGCALAGWGIGSAIRYNK